MFYSANIILIQISAQRKGTSVLKIRAINRPFLIPPADNRHAKVV